MQRAMEETGRRREKQSVFNLEHGITPQTITKKVADIMEGAYGPAAAAARKAGKLDKIAEQAAEYETLAPDQLARKITQLEKRMYQHAQDLEFEEAAQIRDQINQIEKFALGLVSG